MVDVANPRLMTPFDPNKTGVIGNVQTQFGIVLAELPAAVKVFEGLTTLYLRQIGEIMTIELPGFRSRERAEALAKLAASVLDITKSNFPYPKLTITHETVTPGKCSQLLPEETLVGPQGLVIASYNWTISPTISTLDSKSTMPPLIAPQNGDVFFAAPDSTILPGTNDSHQPVGLLHCVVTG